MKDLTKLIELLSEREETIATMESCTGGGVVNCITNVEGSSKVLKFSAVTYSNDFKIKLGVKAETINKFSVYSIETARDMAKKISEYAGSNYGIGITGKLNRADEFNDFGSDNEVFISIYSNNKFFDASLKVNQETRALNKELVINRVIQLLKNILLEEQQ